MSSRRLFFLCSFVVAVCAQAGLAQAATRLGPDLSVPPSGLFAAVGCQPGQYSPCSFVNLHSTNVDSPAVAPSSGVITRWRFRGGCCTEAQTVTRTMTLKTFKPGLQDGQFGYSFIIPVTTGPSFAIPPGNVVSGLVELPARLPIAAGERAGIVADHPIALNVYDPTPGVTMTSVASNTFFNGEAYGVRYQSTALAISVDVEPDADGDGYGDETQDCRPTDPNLNGGCVPVLPTPVQPLPVYKPGPCTQACGGGAVFGGVIQSVPFGDGSVIYVPVTCPPNATQPCGGFLIAAPATPKKAARGAKTKVIGRARYTVAPGKTKKVQLKLTRAGKQLLKRKGRLKVLLKLKTNEGSTITTTRTLRWHDSRGRRGG